MTRELYGVDVTVVGLCGKARSGKDTAAGILRSALLKDVENTVIRSMASTMKGMLVQLFEAASPPGEDYMKHCLSCINGELKEEPHWLLEKSPRELMQTLGTEWGRGMIKQDVWIKVMENKIARTAHELSEMGKDRLVVIIPDIRFDNEAALCDLLVRIDRSDAPEVSAHSSENGIAPHLIAHTINNDGTLEELEKKMGGVAHLVLGEAANASTPAVPA